MTEEGRKKIWKYESIKHASNEVILGSFLECDIRQGKPNTVMLTEWKHIGYSYALIVAISYHAYHHNYDVLYRDMAHKVISKSGRSTYYLSSDYKRKKVRLR